MEQLIEVVAAGLKKWILPLDLELTLSRHFNYPFKGAMNKRPPHETEIIVRQESLTGRNGLNLPGYHLVALLPCVIASQVDVLPSEW